MLSPALRRHVADRAFQNLEQRLLHALAGHIARDGRVFTLARDLVDLVDVDDTALGLFDVVVGVLQQTDDDVLDILANVAGLGEVGGVGDGERDVQNLGQRLRQQRLARPGGSEQEDIRFAQLHVVGAHLRVDALVVVVDGDREDLLRAILAYDVVVQDPLDVGGLGNCRQAEVLAVLLDLLGDDVVAQPDALVADVDRGACNELLDLFLALSTERAGEAGLVFSSGR